MAAALPYSLVAALPIPPAAALPYWLVAAISSLLAAVTPWPPSAWYPSLQWVRGHPVPCNHQSIRPSGQCIPHGPVRVMCGFEPMQAIRRLVRISKEMLQL